MDEGDPRTRAHDSDIGLSQSGFLGPLTPWQIRRAWFTGGFGLGISIMVNFLVPLRAVELGASLGIVGLIVGVGSILPAAFGALIGATSDRFGPRRLFGLATAGASLTAVGMTFANNWTALLVLMVLFGLFRAAGWVSSQAYITSISDQESQTLNASRFSFVTALSRTTNPLLIGVAAQLFGVRTSFLFVACYGVFYFLLALMLVETRSTSENDASSMTSRTRDAPLLLRRPAIQAAMLLSFARVWAAAVLVTFYPLLLIERGLSKALAGSVISTNALVGVVATLFVPRLSRRFSKEILTAIGLFAGASGLAIIPIADGIVASYIPPALVGIGEGLSLPLLISIVDEAAGPRYRGLAIGIRISVNQLAQVSAAFLIGAIVSAASLSFGFTIAGAMTAGVTLTAALRHLSSKRDDH